MFGILGRKGMNKEEHEALIAEIFSENADSIKKLAEIHKSHDDSLRLAFPEFYKRERYFDRMGNPISIDKYIILSCNPYNYKIVKQEKFGDYKISTVWLGNDHNFYQDGLPIIFETMIFKNTDTDRPWCDIYMDRYSTEEEALRGHEIAVEIAKTGKFDEDEK